MYLNSMAKLIIFPLLYTQEARIDASNHKFLPFNAYQSSFIPSILCSNS